MQIDGGGEWKQWQALFYWAPKSLQTMTAATKLRHLILRRKAMTNLDRILKSRNITLPTMMCIVKIIVFPVVMYRCESWTIKKAKHWRTDAFKLWLWRRLLRVPWDTKELKPVNPQGSQSWMFFGRTVAEAPILRPPDVKSWLIRRDPDAGKDWRQEEKGMTEDEIVGWHHQLPEFTQTKTFKNTLM